jgi:hypothetical protein
MATATGLYADRIGRLPTTVGAGHGPRKPPRTPRPRSGPPHRTTRHNSARGRRSARTERHLAARGGDLNGQSVSVIGNKYESSGRRGARSVSAIERSRPDRP